MCKFNQGMQENPMPIFSKSNSVVLGGIYSATVSTKLNVGTLVLEETLLNVYLEYMGFFGPLKEASQICHQTSCHSAGNCRNILMIFHDMYIRKHRQFTAIASKCAELYV